VNRIETIRNVIFDGIDPPLDGSSFLIESLPMPWSVIFCDEFDEEFKAMPKDLRKAITANTLPLEEFGPILGRPQVETLKGSTFPNMKELRFDWMNGVWRIAFAFDPQREAVFLVGGDKRGKNKSLFYKALVRKADERYQRHLDKLSEINHGKKY